MFGYRVRVFYKKRDRKSRCHAYEAQRRQSYFDAVTTAIAWVRSHRTWCFVAACYLAFSTPLATWVSRPVYALPPPQPVVYVQPVALIQPLPATLLEEQSTLALEPTPAPVSAPSASSSASFGYANSYTWGNCTWYVASRVHVPDNLGNANTWASMAQYDGFRAGPARIGAVATNTWMSYLGHVALVIDVQGDQVKVSEMNVNGLGVVDEAWYPMSDWVYIYF